MRTNKQKLTIGIAAIAVAAVCIWLYSALIATTKVALVNFPNFQTTSIAKSTDDPFIKVQQVDIEDIGKLKKYDAVLVFAMGLKLSESQRQQLTSLAGKGLPFYSTAVTNPDNNIVNLDSVQLNQVKKYLENGNSTNYRSLLRYIRREIDGKTWFAPVPDSVVTMPEDAYYHMDEARSFATLAEFEQYRTEKHWAKAGAPKVAIVGSFGDPFAGNRMHLDSLIISLENAGMNVYPMVSQRKRMEMLKELEPDAVVYMPHGRLSMGSGDAAVQWLKQRNIPIFCPLTVLEPEDKWLNDLMGMMGGFLSQSVVMPELDGGIYPYTLNAQFVDNEGFYLFKAIPDRLASFTRIVENYLKLKHTGNSKKKVAVYYFKGAGQSALIASGMEVVPSLHAFLKKLQTEGYNLGNLPQNEKEFEKQIMAQGMVLDTYANGMFDKYLKNGNPALVEKSEYENWAAQAMPSDLYKQVTDVYGPAPGNYMAVEQNGKQYMAVARIEYGNVAILPQPLPAVGNDQFQIVHGAKTAPPHTYIGSYLWTRFGFKADAIVHFGTHGSLEFTPQKQVALSSFDWPDRLVGTMPHFYLYTIANVGEGIIAKRRGYGNLVSHLNPPFMDSDMRREFKSLNERIRIYYNKPEDQKDAASIEVKKLAVALGLHRDLQLDSNLVKPYNFEDIEKIENFADELGNEKMLGQPYTLGTPYEHDKIESSVMAMSADPIAYSLAALDRERGTVSPEQLRNKNYFTQRYLNPSKQFVAGTLKSKSHIGESELMKLANLSKADIDAAHQYAESLKPKSMAQLMAERAKKQQHNGQQKTNEAAPASPHGPQGGHPHHGNGAALHGKSTPEPNKKQLAAILEIERTANNILLYKQYLLSSPSMEMAALLNALNGGYIAPSPGGDAVANPNTLPTGRNLYSINAEATPSESAWDKGVTLAKSTLETYQKRNGTLPRKISYTFWSGEFIESEGATIAQVLYMLGVEPVRDPFGRVSDLRLIPSKELGRPRIDVIVQTSGQFRDLGASRLVLISRAVEMAASATHDEYENYVAQSTVETERILVEKGAAPIDARRMSLFRIFGGLNGNYGTGIMGMVESGDRWENEAEVARTYIHNMGAFYGSDKEWGQFNQHLLEAALHNTDLVVQPRQNNTWGPLSLDHVYEFMGGMSLAVRHVTGKDPEAYFSDYRNRNNVRMQEVKEAVGVEARTTIFNPAYIKEQMKGGASSAENFAETVRNIYGWNVTKPKTIDKEMWDKLHQVYVKDEYKLGVQQFFKHTSPAALQEMTAVMLETARKGYWKASEQQLKDVAQLHTDLVKEFGPSGSGFSGANTKLQDFISQNVPSENADAYKQQIQQMKVAGTSSDAAKKGLVLKKDQEAQTNGSEKTSLNGFIIGGSVLAAFFILLWILRKRRNNHN
ncbi:MAG: cobaltochelatase subunit CobN [Breznakibacter sp.]